MIYITSGRGGDDGSSVRSKRMVVAISRYATVHFGRAV